MLLEFGKYKVYNYIVIYGVVWRWVDLILGKVCDTGGIYCFKFLYGGLLCGWCGYVGV